MLLVTAQASISASREELYDYIVDLALRPAWCDHFMSDYRLAHPDAHGEGAGARYLLDAPGWRHYIEATLVKREGEPKHIAQAVLFFIDNDFVTGVCLPVDGGRTVFSPDSAT